MTPAASGDDLRTWLRRRIAEVLGLPPASVDPDRSLIDLGVSSVQAVSLVEELSGRVAREIPTSLVWSSPSVSALVEAITGTGTTAAPQGAASDEVTVSGGSTPVAVVGAGCRLPGGVNDLEDLWRLLSEGRDAIGEVPEGRWDAYGVGGDPVLAEVPTAGGFLTDIDSFDADFFGVLPREAELMDPQQRILLEVAWNAIENAGIAPSSLRGSRTGVFVGASSFEYAHLTTGDLAGVDAWTATGAAPSILANRLSYLFDLRGPSMTVDTACSSSLVALHQAVRSLAAGECDTAVVAGVNLLLGPAITLNFARAGVLSADGRCRPFDADADGIVRGEGFGVVVLQRLRDARRSRSRILAVVRGTAVGSDGRSNGLMAPNPAAQEQVLRDAYRAAGVDPSGIDYVEAHGTGTPLGDPIEADALGAVHGTGRSADRPLLLGSAKATFGHLEAAAGITGLLKLIAAMQHDRLPPTPGYRAPNPRARLDQNRLQVVDEQRGWPGYSGRRIAGVSSFGFGGTNAHAVLEAFGRRRPVADDDTGVHVLALGAPDPARLHELATSLADRLDSGDLAVSDVAHTLARRDPGRVRGWVAARGRDGAIARLRALDPDDLVSAERGCSGPVWVFSGYGGQLGTTGVGLLDDDAAFAGEVDRLDEWFPAEAGFALRAALTGQVERGLVTTQVSLYGLQLALAASWRARGLEPAAVVGHSMGEVAAAVVSGVIDARTGLRVMVARSRLLAGIDGSGAGAMAVLGMSPAELEAHRDLAADVEVAVHASPSRITVAGPAAQVQALAARIEADGRLARQLDVGGAGHSAAVDPILAELRETLGDVSVQEPTVRSVSTLDPSGAIVGDVDYWCANARRTVRFSDAVRVLLDDGHRTFVEMSPHPIACGAVVQTADAVLADGGGRLVVATGSLRRGGDDQVEMAVSVGRLHAGGHTAPLRAACADGSVVDVPTTSWLRRAHWVETRRPSPRRETAGHPLLGTRVAMPGRHVWHTDVGTDVLPWLADHEALGAPVLPGAAFLEMVLSAAVEAWSVPTERVRVERLELLRVLPLAPASPVTVVLVDEDSGGSVEVLTCDAGGSWSVHARAHVLEATSPAPADVDARPGGDDVDVYARFASVGQHYGPAFRGVVSAQARDGLAAGRVRLPDSAGRSSHDRLHPALVDAALHVLAAAFDPTSDDASAYLPVSIGRVVVHSVPVDDVEVLAEVRTEPGSDRSTGWLRMLDSDGQVLVELSEVGLQRLVTLPSRNVLGLAWEQRALPAAPAVERGRTWAVLGENVEWTDALCESLAERDDVVRRPTGLPADEPAALQADHVLLAWPAPGSTPDPGAAERLTADVLTLARTLASTGTPPPRLWLAGPGAQVVGDGDARAGNASGLRAVVRVLAFEHPELRATLVDLEPELSASESARALLSEVDADDLEDEVAYRQGRRLVARVRRTVLEPLGEPAVVPESYVITGGLGGLGLTVARLLADRGARRLVLSGRSGPSREADAVLAELRSRGTEVVVVRGDLASDGVAGSLVAAAREDGLRLRGVVHAAGVLADATLDRVTDSDVHRAWQPKGHGAVRLDEAARAEPLDWWVSFSSVAALVGSPGQAAYASANAWLDGFTSWQRAQGVPATSVQWGVWGEVGAVAERDDAILAPLSVDEALRGLEQALVADRPVLAVARLAADRAAEMFPGLRQVPLLGDLLSDDPDGAEATESGAQLAALRAAPAAEQWGLLLARLRLRIAAIAALAPDELDVSVPLSRLGLDSLMATRARHAVEQDYGVGVPVPLLLRDVCLSEVAAYVAEELGVAVGDAAPADEHTRDLAHIDPRDTAERIVAGAWRAVLGTGPVSVRDPFETLGGDVSLLEHVLERIRQRAGTVDRHRFDVAMTVEQMADPVRELVEPAPGEVVRRLAPGSDGGRTLFLFHPAGGPTSVYGPLVERLAASTRCFGMERLEAHDTVESKASEYRDRIVELDPHGPYLLGGWSFGGCLAYEVARVLRAEGRAVEVVAMIDSILPLPGDGNESDDELDRMRRFVEHIEATYDGVLPLEWDEVASASGERRIELVMGAITAANLSIPPAALHHQYTSYVDARIAERYDPEPYDGRVVLYRAGDPHPLTTSLDPRYLRTDEDLGWAPRCPALEVVTVPGDHLSLIDPPSVDVIAAHLGTSLDGAPAGRRP